MTAELSDAEKITNAETMRHILTIRALLMEAVRELVNRGDAHDLSKLAPPEVDYFTKNTHTLAKLTYGSEEYKQALANMKPALENHYAHNKHHTEHWPNGIHDMDLFDMLEMLLDWKAATLRHANGDILKSIELNAVRYGMPPALVKLIKNTLPQLDKMVARSRVAVSYPHVPEIKHA